MAKETRNAFLGDHILVKGDKPHACYQFYEILEDLKEMPAARLAEAIKGKPENLGCESAYELVFQYPTRFKSIQSFREMYFNEKNMADIEQNPLMLLNPTKNISHFKFKYDLERCPKVPARKTKQRQDYKEKNNITTQQGKPIFSSFHIYKHYLKLEQWKRAAQLPSVLGYLERATYCHQLIARIGCYVHPEFVLWATSAAGTHLSRKCYETLETYGDTILKLAATLLGFEHYKHRA